MLRDFPMSKIIHHNDCTWCKHRKTYKKAIERRYELELCGLDNHKISAPFKGVRFCEQYQQVNCPCEKCNSTITSVMTT